MGEKVIGIRNGAVGGKDEDDCVRVSERGDLGCGRNRREGQSYPETATCHPKTPGIALDGSRVRPAEARSRSAAQDYPDNSRALDDLNAADIK
jgi:hypothetical protein